MTARPPMTELDQLKADNAKLKAEIEELKRKAKDAAFERYHKYALIEKHLNQIIKGWPKP